MKFKKEERYLVIKRDDIMQYLTPESQGVIYALAETINNRRLNDGRGFNRYICVNDDAPYANEVWKMIEKHVNAQ